MADPWTRSAPAIWPYGAGGASGDHVTSLANNTILGLGYIDNSSSLSSPYGDIILPIWQITTGSGTISGTLQRWLVMGESSALFTGGLNPNSASDLTSALNNYLTTNSTAQNTMLLDTINVSASGTAYYFPWRSLYAFIGNVPTYVGILLQNLSGQTLSSTAALHSTMYVIDSYT